MYRIGIDVGGTNTDAVIMQEGKILTGVKSATTADVMSGVVASLVKALENHPSASLDAPKPNT